MGLAGSCGAFPAKAAPGPCLQCLQVAEAVSAVVQLNLAPLAAPPRAVVPGGLQGRRTRCRLPDGAFACRVRRFAAEVVEFHAPVRVNA
jgi:hypothetical protein